MTIFLQWVDATGSWSLRLVKSLYGLLEEISIALGSALAGRQKGGGFPLSETLKQIYFTGTQALLPTFLMGLGIGLFAGLYQNADLQLLGGNQVLARILTQLSVEALGPLVISFLVIARSGTAVASELGSMRVNREIDALRVICIHPYAFLIFPRIFGGSLAVVCLGFVFTFILVLTHCLAIYFSEGVSPVFSFEALIEFWTIGFLFLLLLKYLFSALLIFSISSRQGLAVRRSSSEVPRATSQAVLQCVLAVFVVHSLIFLLQNLEFLVGGHG